MRSAIRPTLRVAGDQLGGAGEDEGHHHERDGAAEAHARRAVARAGARALRWLSCDPGEETGGIEMPLCAVGK